MDSNAIKSEPDTTAEESVAVILTDIDIDYHFIKKECPECISEINSGEISKMESSNLEGVTIKAEPGTKEGKEIDISCAEIGIDLPDIKMEGFEHSERIHQTAGSINVELVPIKVEPESLEEVKVKGIPYADNDIDLLDVKQECLQHSEGLTQTKDLLTNLEAHPGEKRYSCPHCKYSYSLKSTLKRHMRTHTKPFSCSDCNYSCSRKAGLKSHMLTHSGEKPFSCPDCNFSFSTKSNLKKHMYTHSGEKPFSCPDCNYSVSNKSNLTKHMFTHSGEKPFSCPDCSYSCSSKGQLKIHTFSHSKVKPFTCLVCDYSCSTKRQLKNHTFTHSGKKPFTCLACNNSFSQISSLTRHKRLICHSRSKPVPGVTAPLQ